MASAYPTYEKNIAYLASQHCDVITLEGAPPFMILGPDGEAKMVDGCTDSYVEDPKKKENWERRKIRYLHRVRHEDAETRFVSAADKLYNARAILRDLRNDGDIAFARFTAPKAKTLWYYRSLVREYRLGGVTHRLKPLIDDLDRVVTELEHLSGILVTPIQPPRRISAKLKTRS